MDLIPLTPEQEREILKQAEYLKSFGGVDPEVKRRHEAESARQTHIVDGSSTMHCACDKVVKTLDMPRGHSGVVPFIDNICPGCEQQAKGLSPVICGTCHKVAGRLQPETDRHGFKIERGRCYHIERCPSCCPGDFEYGRVGEIARTPIIEMLLYHRSRGVKS